MQLPARCSVTDGNMGRPQQSSQTQVCVSAFIPAEQCVHRDKNRSDIKEYVCFFKSSFEVSLKASQGNHKRTSPDTHFLFLFFFFPSDAFGYVTLHSQRSWMKLRALQLHLDSFWCQSEKLHAPAKSTGNVQAGNREGYWRCWERLRAKRLKLVARDGLYPLKWGSVERYG